MNIDRHQKIINYKGSEEWIGFCLNRLEKASDFIKGLDWSSEIVKHLTIEEVIGALIYAEQKIKEQQETMKYYEKHLGIEEVE